MCLSAKDMVLVAAAGDVKDGGAGLTEMDGYQEDVDWSRGREPLYSRQGQEKDRVTYSSDTLPRRMHLKAAKMIFAAM